MRLLPTTVLLTLALITSGCNKSDAEQQMSDMTAKQREIVTVLKDVKDVESAKAANIKVKAIAADIQKILERSKTTKSTQEEQKRIVEKYKPQQQEITKEAQAELQRISQIPGASMELMEGFMAVSTAGLRAGAGAK
jgi:TPP-dependent 2-oxoacid decarboxylase